ncbi:unnamed protein product [Owenia fusiformis]|uniref:UDENN domain-containing protein n=1 Tax=Owenia fusiformis TaxID=6347 RepID=A0A8S4N0T8_OWEFU|nr:unnamed protein product [Owenia fusiformis]
MTSRLHNSLCEAMLVVGLDQYTGLRPAQPQPRNAVKNIEVPFTQAYEPQVLAAISSNVAMFPQAPIKMDPYYPYSAGVTRYKSQQALKQPGQRPSRRISMGIMGSGHRTAGLDRSRRSTMRSRRMSVKPQELPISTEVINSLHAFCFPDYAYVHKRQRKDRVHYLVLTDVTGDRSYATCLTYYRQVLIEKEMVDNETEWKFADMEDKDIKEVQLTIGQFKVWLPVCCVMISSHPYLTVMKDCLSSLVQLIKQDHEEMNTFLKDYTRQLTMTPVPPAGMISINFSLYQLTINLHSSDHPDRNVIDIPLNIPFLSFTMENLLKIIACMLTQQRIVFMSTSYAILTIVMESFLNFIHPFEWQHPYVPILPSRLLELVDAPGTFLMGCHAEHRPDIEQVDGIVIVDIDSGQVEVSDSLYIPSLPSEPVSMFRTATQRIMPNFDLILINSTSCLSLEEVRLERRRLTEMFNRFVTASFMELMVNLFRDVLTNIKVIKADKRYFNKENFLESQLPGDTPFYEQVVNSDMFNKFLRDRMNDKRDSWVEFEEKTRPVARNSLQGVNDKSELIRPLLLKQRRSSSSCVSVADPTKLIYSTSGVTTIFHLPEFKNTDGFYERSCQEISIKLETSKLPSLRAPLLYLRGMLRVACGRPVEGLEDFYNLSANDTRLFPRQVIRKVLSVMSTVEKSKLTESEFYRKSALFRKIDDEASHIESIHIDIGGIPQTDIDFNEFYEAIQIVEIAADYDTIVRLFESLTLGKQDYVDPVTFEMLYECWKENEVQCREVHPPEGFLDPNECILKVSNMMKCDRGTGRLALTQKRLFFLQEGSKKFVEIIKLRDISSLEKIQQMSFLVGVEALRVYSKVSECPPFVACLKEERNCWCMLVTEMAAGKVIAEELRDPGIVQQAAQNVLLVDAVIRSGEENCCSHHTSVERAASYLCYFTRRKEDGVDKLPPDTKHVLQHRINPNVREVDKKAIEALLYTPGNKSGSSNESDSEIELGPKLWCAMGSGKVLVYDASTWLLQAKFTQAKGRVVCLVAVGENQIWAGSFDKTIYVIDIATVTSNQSLMEHTDMLSDITVSKDHRTAFSASLNGQILVWDTEKLQSMYQINLAVQCLSTIQWVDGNLWCGTKERIIVVTEAGGILKRLHCTDEAKYTLSIDCFLITPHKEVWTGCGRQGLITIWDQETFEEIRQSRVECRGISKMVLVQNKVWVGSKSGFIYIFNCSNHLLEQQLKAHNDSVRSMCTAQNRYIMSGAGSEDGKVAIWRASTA